MINRRSFLQQGLAVVSLGLGVPSVFGRAVAASAAENAGASGKTLIVLQLSGGVDGLNTVVPFKDPAYRTLRRSIALPENELIRIDDRVAFHPNLGGFKSLLDAGKLAVIEGVGYPEPNFSHFKATDIWESGDPSGTGEGWLGRYFDGLVDAEGHPLAGVSIGRSLPGSLTAKKASVPSVESLDAYRLQEGPMEADPALRQSSLLRLYDVYRPANTPFAALLDTALDSAVDSADQLAAAHAAYTPAVEYPNSSLASGLRLLAELIDSGDGEGGASPLRVGHVQLGGFDMHTQEPQRLGVLLTELAEGLQAFWRDVEGHGHGDDVLVLTWSEFGRRPEENGQNGTDHGSAGPMFVVANKLRPGFHGEPPSLTNLDNGNLRYTTDFRSVYATVLEDWLGASASGIIKGRFDKLKLLSA